MKKLLLSTLMFCMAFTAFSQQTKKDDNAFKAADIQLMTLDTERTTDGAVALEEEMEAEVIPADVPVMTFVEEVYNFGTVKSGDVVEHVFTFTNTGTAPLVIEKAKSTCGCTVPQFPREPILPGESGEIAVKFNSKNKSGRQRKPINITANTNPKLTTVYIDGRVDK